MTAIFRGTTESCPNSQKAGCSAEIIRNGIDPGEGSPWKDNKTDVIEYRFDTDMGISGIRIVSISIFG